MVEQKGAKLVDASSMSVRVHAEKAVSAEHEKVCGAQKRQVRTYFCIKGTIALEKTWKSATCQGETGQQNVEETWKNAASQGREGGTKEKTDMGG